MTRRLALSIALCSALLGGGVDLAAQSIPSPYRFVENSQEAGAFVGYFAAGSDRFGLGPKSAPLVGIRYGLNITGPIGLEAVFSASPTTRDVVNPNRLEGDRVIEEAESVLALAEARIRIALTGNRTWRGLQPFGLIGVGLATDIAGAQSEDLRLSEEFRFDFGTRFAGSFGGGTRWILSDRFHARVDLTAQLYQIENPAGFRDPEIDLGAPVPQSQWVTSPTVSAGFAIRF